MNRVKKVVLGIMMLGMAGIASAQSPQEPLEEVITIETYFPAPWAEVDELRLYPSSRDYAYCIDDRRGTMYYDEVENKVKVCKGAIDGWQELGGGFWTASGNDIYNSNTGNVGIGTTSPKYPLTVFNELGGQISIIGDSDADAANILLFSDGTNNFEDGWIIQSSQNTNAFRLIPYDEGINLGVKMTILKDGNVGIGTTDPVEKLDVDGLIKTKFFGSVPSDSDNGPEAYRVTTGGPPCDASHRGSIAVMRPSGAGPQDALCFCGDIAGDYMWSCFNL